jgi:hypothetical protein
VRKKSSAIYAMSYALANRGFGRRIAIGLGIVSASANVSSGMKG